MRRARGSNLAATAGVLIGVGMGGFVDGIVLHQILQWHNMLSNWVPPTSMDAMRVNMLWDGIFHALVWLVTFTGILLLWQAARRGDVTPSGRALAGQFLFGWGLFNLIEGIIDHQVLQIHYVREVAGYQAYNLTFLAIGGVLFLVLGWLLMRNAEHA